MGVINFFGIGVIVAILVPNVIFALKCPDGFQNPWKNKLVETLEQICRFGCFVFMIVNVPGTFWGFASEGARTMYFAADSVLVAAYLAIWAVCAKKNNTFRAAALSSIPAAMFLASGVLLRSILLSFFALIFAPTHILLSCKNAAAAKK